MDIRKIKKLIDLMIESDLQAIEVKEGDQSISLTRPTPVYAAAPVAAGLLVYTRPVTATSALVFAWLLSRFSLRFIADGLQPADWLAEF